MKCFKKVCAAILGIALISVNFQPFGKDSVSFAQSNSSVISVENGNRLNHTYMIYNETLWKWGGIYHEAVKISDEKGWKTLSCSSRFEMSNYLGLGKPFLQESHVLLLKKDGSLWAMGGNESGQLGDGTKKNQEKPIRIGTSNDWAYVSAGNSYSAALKKDGSLWVWGKYDHSIEKKRPNANLLIPQKIGLTKWKEISATGLYGITTTGKIEAWGLAKSEVPSSGQNKNWKMLTYDNGYLAVKTDGSLWGIGSNYNSQIGEGTVTYRYKTLKASKTGKGWMVLSKSNNRSAGVKSDGTLWLWGLNLNKEFGLATTKSVVNVPTQFGKDKDWTNVSLNEEYVVATKKDGSVWAWGLILQSEEEALSWYPKPIVKPIKIMDGAYAKKYEEAQLTFGDGTVSGTVYIGEEPQKPYENITVTIYSEGKEGSSNIINLKYTKGSNTIPFKTRQMPPGKYSAKCEFYRGDRVYEATQKEFLNANFVIDKRGNCDQSLDIHFNRRDLSFDIQVSEQVELSKATGIFIWLVNTDTSVSEDDGYFSGNLAINPSQRSNKSFKVTIDQIPQGTYLATIGHSSNGGQDGYYYMPSEIKTEITIDENGNISSFEPLTITN